MYREAKKKTENPHSVLLDYGALLTVKQRTSGCAHAPTGAKTARAPFSRYKQCQTHARVMPLPPSKRLEVHDNVGQQGRGFR